jgi:SpoVK/Ycf46/Vps4 family AAA+-type ATPase
MYACSIYMFCTLLHRFDEVIYAGLPDAAEREHILERARSRAAADGAPWHSSVSTAQLAARTASYSGADLAGLVRNAAVAALQRGLEREAAAAAAAVANSSETTANSADSSSVSQADVEMELVLDQECFERALARTSPSSDAAAVQRYTRWAQRWSRRFMPT